MKRINKATRYHHAMLAGLMSLNDKSFETDSAVRACCFLAANFVAALPPDARKELTAIVLDNFELLVNDAVRDEAA